MKLSILVVALSIFTTGAYAAEAGGMMKPEMKKEEGGMMKPEMKKDDGHMMKPDMMKPSK